MPKTDRYNDLTLSSTYDAQPGDPEQIALSNPYKYVYPNKLDLRPSSELHKRLARIVLTKAAAGHRAIRTRFAGWREIDRVLTAYIPKSDAEKAIKGENSTKPVSVVVPVTYATLETLLTYWVSAFLEDPYFKYGPAGPEDALGAALLELSVASQCRRSKVALGLHTMWRDSFAYGVGGGSIGWTSTFGYREVSKMKRVWSSLKGVFVDVGEEASEERVETFSGSTFTPFDPYMCLPDPDTPMYNVQDSEFFGYVDRKNLMSWLDKERNSNNEYFNLNYCKHFRAMSKYNGREYTGREDLFGGPKKPSSATSPVDVIHMFVRLIPFDLGLGDSKYPELWMLSLAGDRVIVRAKPLGLRHNQIPVAVCAPDYDGHSVVPISRLETVYGLQEYINWQFNSRMANVRKAINDMFVVDPQMINIGDITNPKPGKLIRLRRLAFGRGVKDSIMQLQVNDITANNIADIASVTNMMRETTGCTDVVSGIRRHTSERVSATEAAGTARGALSRLEKAARITALQAHQDIGYQMGWNTIQLMKEEKFARLVGDWAVTLAKDFNIEPERGLVKIKPSDLNIDFDVILGDGTIPTSGDPDLWLRLFQVVSSNNYLMQELDAVRMFKFGARMAGAKNLNDFVRAGGNVNAQVKPNEEVLDEVEKGNLVSLQQ